MSAEDEDVAGETPTEPHEAKKPAAAKKRAAAKKPAVAEAQVDETARADAGETPDGEETQAVEAKPAAKKRATKKGAASGAATEEPAGAADEPAAERAESPESAQEPAAERQAKPATATTGGGSRRTPRRRVVRAHARYVRTSARKARMVSSHLRGKTVDEARAILAFTPREVARDWSKLLESAVANAENNHELIEDDLVVREAYADEGPTIKRFRPRAMGRATPIHKRTSHLTITLTPGS
jgi:ribosomal protein L22